MRGLTKNYFSKILLTCVLAVIAISIAVSIAATPVASSAIATKSWKFALDTTSNAEALELAESVEVKMNEEGMILLKNKSKALPIAKNSGITVFGEDGSVYQEALIAGGFTNVNPNLISNTSVSSTSVEVNAQTGKASYGVTSITKKQEQSLDFYGDVAIISIDRDGISEGQDAKENWGIEAAPEFKPGGTFAHQYLETEKANEEATASTVYQHQLMPTDAELRLVDYAIEHCRKVIIAIGNANTFELEAFEENDKVDAIIWAGQVGDNGIDAFPEILSGDVNPSGRTSDFFEADFTTDPVWHNFGDYTQVYKSDWYKQAAADAGKTAVSNNYLREKTEEGTRVHTWQHKSAVQEGVGLPVVAYEEGIYMGYKYWETAAAELSWSEDKYDSMVCYPFGYGLSYTTFAWSDFKVSRAGEWADWATQTEMYTPAWTERNCWTMDVQVTVTNTGDVAGKDVVEVYSKAPYYSGEVEKASVNLVGFEKTRMLNPGESETLTITIAAQDIASFDYNDANSNGKSVYELDAGHYYLSFQKNSHEAVGEVELAELKTDVILDKDDYSGNALENILSQDNAFNSLGYDEISDGVYGTLEDKGLITQLSRSDWANTDPVKTPYFEDQLLRGDAALYFIETWEGFDACNGGWGGEPDTSDLSHEGDTYFFETGDNTLATVYNEENPLVDKNLNAAAIWFITSSDFAEKTNPNGDEGVAWTQVVNDNCKGSGIDIDQTSTFDASKEGNVEPTIMWRDMLGIACFGPEGQVKYTYSASAKENSEETHTTKIPEFDNHTGWECWSIFMNQLSWTTIKAISSYNGYSTEIDGIHKPYTIDGDGPRHWPDTGYNWGSECTMAATWNYDLVWDIGVAYVNLGKTNYFDVWQGPGANCHRSHFLGRFDDYMSQDGYHGGRLNSAIIGAVQSRGGQVCQKHGILNDQETDRQGVRTYANEQACREIYFKIFQMGMQEGEGGEMMNSLACVGDIDCSINPGLTHVIYQQWGWFGYITTDGYDGASSYLPMDAMMRSNVCPLGHVSPTSNVYKYLSGAWYDDCVYTAKSRANNSYHRSEKVVTVTETTSGTQTNVSVTVYPDLLEKPEDAEKNYNQWYYTRLNAIRTLYSQLYTAISTNGIDTYENNIGSGMGSHYGIAYAADYAALDKSTALEANEGASFSADISVPAYAEECAYFVTYTVSPYSDDQLPAGLTLSEDGKISGTPTESGVFKLRVYAMMDNQPEIAGYCDFTLTVNSAWKLDEDLTADFADAKVNKAFSGKGSLMYSPTSSQQGGQQGGGSSSSYTYELAEGSYLPAGLTLGSDGKITGTPTQAGNYEFTVNAITEQTAFSLQFSSTKVTYKEVAYTHTFTLYIAADDSALTQAQADIAQAKTDIIANEDAIDDLEDEVDANKTAADAADAANKKAAEDADKELAEADTALDARLAELEEGCGGNIGSTLSVVLAVIAVALVGFVLVKRNEKN